METQQFFVSRDVFYENEFPFVSSLPTPSTVDHMAYGGENGSWEFANADMEARGVLWMPLLLQICVLRLSLIHI